MSKAKSIPEEILQANVKTLESFCLLPALHKDKQLCLRFQLRETWSGWSLRDDVAKSLELDPGATMMSTVRSYWGSDMSTDVKSLDFFASGESAQWLIKNCVSPGDIFDCEVRLFFGHIGEDAKFNVIALVMTKGLQVVSRRDPIQPDISNSAFPDFLEDFSE